MEIKENLKERLKHQVMERMDISRTMEDEEILELVQKTLEEDSHRMPMSISMRQNLIREIFHSCGGWIFCRSLLRMLTLQKLW